MRERAPTPSCKEALRFRGPISGSGAKVTDDEDEEGDKVLNEVDRKILCGVTSDEDSVREERED